jgi:hypothetical protein
MLNSRKAWNNRATSGTQHLIGRNTGARNAPLRQTGKNRSDPVVFFRWDTLRGAAAVRASRISLRPSLINEFCD